MAESLLPWYERELDFLRHRVDNFAKEHPTLSNRLGIRKDSIDDPHVLRLIDSFALCNARLSRQLAEESTQISNNLLQVLFPLALQPLPATSMIRIPSSADQAEVSTVPYGTRFRINIDEQQYCLFHTTADLQLCPFDIVSHALILSPFDLPAGSIPEGATAALKLDLALLDNSRLFSDLSEFQTVNLHFKGLLRNHGVLYDYLCRNRLSTVVLEENGEHFFLSDDCLEPMGFSQKDRMLTQKNSTFIDSQIIMEFMAWPDLFYGFRIKGLSDIFRKMETGTVSLVFFLNDIPESVLRIMDFVTPLLGCSPAINLFEHIAEPVVVDHSQLSYPIIPDSQAVNQLEIQCVNRVLDITNEEPVTLPPLFGLYHNEPNNNQFWLFDPADPESNDKGELTLIYPELNPHENQTMILSPSLICSNGEQALKLPVDPDIECLDSISLPSQVQLLNRPTAPAKRSYNIRDRLNLLTHLSRNFNSLLNERDTSRALKSMFSMYDFRSNPISIAWIKSVISMKSKPQVASLLIDGRQCFSWGTEVEVVLDEDKLENASIMLFINLLDFLASYLAGYQSFIQLVVRLKGKPGEYYRCSRRHGNQLNR